MKSVSKQKIISSDGTDTASKSKRVKFDEDGEIETPKKAKLLLESDDEDEEFIFPEDSEFKSKSRAKLAKLQSSIGNDARFTVDERFLEDEDLDENQQKEEEIDEYSDEKKKQLEILGSILGKPISAKISHDEKEKKTKRIGEMVRYDPTIEQHQEYEILPDNKEKKVKKKKKKEVKIVEEPETVTVSKEIFYSVSDNLTTVLGGGEEFSLLKAFGKESIEPENEKIEPAYECDSRNKIFGFNFDSKKAFAYDTSDEEEVNENSHKTERKKADSSNFVGSNDRFLFIIDDPRFQECEEFFKNRPERGEDLKTLRPKLKQTIRKRIRTNLKKNSAPHKRLRKKKF